MLSFLRLVNQLPPPERTPCGNSRLCEGLINHWFPLISPAINPAISGGGTLGWGGRLTSSDICLNGYVAWHHTIPRDNDF